MEINLKNVTLKAGKKRILDDININFKEGDRVAILGPNGAGKTSLINVILNLQKFKQGHVQNDFMKLPAFKIGVHLQENKLNGLMKVKEVIKLFSFESPQHNFISKYNLSDKIDQKIATLSGGEKQKLLLILAMQNNPEILLIDEITTGLDYQSRHSIIDFINNEMGNKTLIMVTHYLEEAENICDKFVFMNNGKILDVGNKNELFEKYKVMKTVCIEFLSDVAFSENIKHQKIVDNIYEIYISDKQDMIKTLNYISKNNEIIKRYDISEPTLEKLYYKIIEGEN